MLVWQRGGKKMTPVITQYSPKDICNMDKPLPFYNVQMKSTLALNGENAKEGKGVRTE
jgi:hypothetical protein